MMHIDTMVNLGHHKVNQFGRIHSLPEHKAQALHGNKSLAVLLILIHNMCGYQIQKLLTCTLFAFEME